MSNTTPSLPTRPESAPETALAAWFAKQQTQSVDNLEAAARQLVTLCSTLLGLLLGLMALTKQPLPPHMSWSGVQWLSGLGVVGLLAALACALAVILPRRISFSRNDPDSQQAAFSRLLAYKSQWLQRAAWLFGAAMLCLALVVLVALWFVV